jgi:hypothetical protein
MHTLKQLQNHELLGITRLNLSENLSEFPMEILELADTLEILSLTNNNLSSLPSDFDKLTKLKILFCANNAFTEVPKVLAKCASLEMIAFKSNQISTFAENSLPLTTRWLILTNNQITTLPNSIGDLQFLQKVALAGNQIHTLPDQMQNCKHLGLLRISANQISTLPNWIYTLPKLAWLGFAGNPLCKALPQSSESLPSIGFDELYFDTTIGEGASGVISKGHKLQCKEPVAIKVFKGDVTSDGYPQDEMNAAVQSGKHPNLINIMADLKEHPDQKEGLILELIGSDYKVLGNSPDFETCTRDTFTSGKIYSYQTILSILKGLASVLAHLRERNILHGDLYTHNILVDPQGHALLGDFGAASNMQGLDEDALEKIEVRSFGYIIDDLLKHLLIANEFALATPLAELLDSCLDPEVSNRPNFSTISKILETLEAL